MDAERDGAIPLSELGDIASTVQRAVDQIARSLSNRDGSGRPPESLRTLSRLEAVGIQTGSAILEIEAPHHTEPFPLEFTQDDAGVQAIMLFVDSLDALSRGEDLPGDIGTKAPKTVRRFARIVGSHERIEIEATVGQTSKTATLTPQEMPTVGPRLEKATGQGRSVTLVGRLYEANLREGHYRIEDETGKTRFLRSNDEIDDQTLARSYLGEMVAVEAVQVSSELEPIHYEVQSIDPIDRGSVGGFYDWSISEAAEKVEPVADLAAFAIPDLSDEETGAFRRAVKS